MIVPEVPSPIHEFVTPEELWSELRSGKVVSPLPLKVLVRLDPKAVVKLVLADEGMIGVATSERLRVISAGQVMVVILLLSTVTIASQLAVLP